MASPSTGGETVRWQPVPDLQWRRLEDSIAVRVPSTGSTHLLSEAASALLEALTLSGTPMAVEPLAATLVEAPRADDLRAIHALLDGLCAQGVLSRATP